MNIALSAVVIFILLLSPVIFYLSFTNGRFSKARPKIGLLDGLMLSAVCSIVLHALALCMFEEVRFDIIVLFVAGDLKAFDAVTSNAEFKMQFQSFVWYNATLIAIAMLSGRFFVGLRLQMVGIYAPKQCGYIIAGGIFFMGIKPINFSHQSNQLFLIL